MKISHEVPLTLLETSRFFNDFDYALVHLFEKYPKYLDFYKESVRMGRTVFLDNSLYELGEAFDPNEYLKWINELKPTHYIIPDTFWDTDGTMKQAMSWMLNQNDLVHPEIKKIGVAQGGCYEDIVRCYKFMDTIADVIAFTFKFPPDFLEKSGDHFVSRFIDLSRRLDLDSWVDTYNKEATTQAFLRYVVLQSLEQDRIINGNKEHHLLGLQNTFLLDKFKKFLWLTSIDTSNPIIKGLLEEEYECPHYHCPKPTEQLKDFFETELSTRQFNDVRYNVLVFRQLAGENPIIINE